MLTEQDIVSYLLLKKLITPEHVVSGDLSITDNSRRHRNYRITFGTDLGLFLKQGIGTERASAIAREATFLQRIESQTAFSSYVPPLCSFDESEHLVLQQLIVDAEDLHQYHASRGYFPTTLARAMGKALGILHQLDQPLALTGSMETPTPWVLSLNRPTLRFYRECSAANQQIIRIVQEFSSFGDELDHLCREWRDETLIHGDIKWDNFLVLAKAGSERKTRIMIVDWELVGTGDPCWDVGSVMSAYLSFWLGSIPLVGELPEERFLDLARYPLEKMLPALHAFWDAYTRNLRLDDAQIEQLLLRAIRFAAARLVQTAFEQMQESIQLSGSIETMLQLSANVLERPEAAAVQLLGFQLGCARL